MLVAAALVAAFVVAVVVGSLSAGSEVHVMPNGQTMTGGSMTSR